MTKKEPSERRSASCYITIIIIVVIIVINIIIITQFSSCIYTVHVNKSAGKRCSMGIASDCSDSLARQADLQVTG